VPVPELQPAEVLSDSLQDYLEAVYMLVQRDGVARMKEIAAHMDVGKSSATGAVQALAERGLVQYDPYQFIRLTERGEAAGRDLVRGHEVLKRFLIEVLGVSDPEAEVVGCKMEHAIQGQVLDRFVRFLEFVQQQAAGKGAWAGAFRRFRANAGGGRSSVKRKAASRRRRSTGKGRAAVAP
jgi:DtxR family transcriptional regulator, Mn-dependent transcriptional regulator